jgi:phospholipid/cholesterol/gamma-HCH transport system substrate-binding protein
MGRNLIETIMGAVVLVVAGFFLVFAYTHTDLKEVSGYEITAQFSSVGGLDKGSDIRINGVKVGTVADYELDKLTFNAVVKMSISPDIRLPVDTVATIATEGLLGGKFVKLIPGRSKDRIDEGGRITKTKDFKSIEEMVGELIFLATADNPPPPAPVPPAVPAEPASPQ